MEVYDSLRATGKIGSDCVYELKSGTLCSRFDWPELIAQSPAPLSCRVPSSVDAGRGPTGLGVMPSGNSMRLKYLFNLQTVHR